MFKALWASAGLYVLAVLFERILHASGIDALAFVWPHRSPSLGDGLQWALLGCAVACGGVALSRRPNASNAAAALTVAALLALQTSHLHLVLAHAWAPQAGNLLIPGLNPVQELKLLIAGGLWLALCAGALLAHELAEERDQRRCAFLLGVGLLCFGPLGGVADASGMAAGESSMAFATLSGLAEELAEFAGAGLLLVAMRGLVGEEVSLRAER